MSNNTIFSIFMCSSIGLIGVFAFTWSIKEGKDRLNKVKEQQELKKKRNTAPNQG